MIHFLEMTFDLENSFSATAELNELVRHVKDGERSFVDVIDV